MHVYIRFSNTLDAEKLSFCPYIYMLHVLLIRCRIAAVVGKGASSSLHIYDFHGTELSAPKTIVDLSEPEYEADKYTLSSIKWLDGENVALCWIASNATSEEESEQVENKIQVLNTTTEDLIDLDNFWAENTHPRQEKAPNSFYTHVFPNWNLAVMALNKCSNLKLLGTKKQVKENEMCAIIAESTDIESRPPEILEGYDDDGDFLICYGLGALQLERDVHDFTTRIYILSSGGLKEIFMSIKDSRKQCIQGLSNCKPGEVQPLLESIQPESACYGSLMDLCGEMKAKKAIRSDYMERAFQEVDRKDFLPFGLKPEAYLDKALIDEKSHVHHSAPSIYAGVLECLELEDLLKNDDKTIQTISCSGQVSTKSSFSFGNKSQSTSASGSGSSTSSFSFGSKNQSTSAIGSGSITSSFSFGNKSQTTSSIGSGSSTSSLSEQPLLKQFIFPPFGIKESSFTCCRIIIFF